MCNVYVGHGGLSIHYRTSPRGESLIFDIPRTIRNTRLLLLVAARKWINGIGGHANERRRACFLKIRFFLKMTNNLNFHAHFLEGGHVICGIRNHWEGMKKDGENL